MKKKSAHSQGGVAILVRTSAMLFGLLAVIFAMRQLKSGSPELNLLFDAQKIVSWCPDGTAEVELYRAGKKIEQLELIQQLCRYSPEAVNSEVVKQSNFKAVALARSQSRTEKILEADAESHIFRVDGLPFKSEKLEKAIQDQAQ